MYIAAISANVSILPNLFHLFYPGSGEIRPHQGELSGDQKNPEVPSLEPRRIRPIEIMEEYL
jgi:hypothetical protein